MAMLGLRVPHETGRFLAGIDVPGEKVDSGSYHLTLLYLGDDVPMEQLVGAVQATYEVVQKARPFGLRIDRVSSFPGNEDGTPIICPVESPALSALRAELVASFDRHGVGFSRKFPVFQGHVTLSYHEGEAPSDQMFFHPLEWGVHEVVLWGGDQGDERLTVTFPFNPEGAKAACFRGAVKFAKGLNENTAQG